MFIKIWIPIVFVLDVWTFEVYLNGFQNLISDNSSFNSFLTPENDLESLIAQNSTSSGCVRLITNETKPEETILSSMCDKLDTKCSNGLGNYWSIANPNICKLQGNLSDVLIIIDETLNQNFIHILIRGCYYVNNRTQIRTDYIWTLTNNTYLKYSSDDNTNKNVSMKFVDGSTCDHLCNAIGCTEVSTNIEQHPFQRQNLQTVKSGFLKSLLIFGILATVVIFISGLSFGFLKFYNKV